MLQSSAQRDLLSMYVACVYCCCVRFIRLCNMNHLIKHYRLAPVPYFA